MTIELKESIGTCSECDTRGVLLYGDRCIRCQGDSGFCVECGREALLCFSLCDTCWDITTGRWQHNGFSVNTLMGVVLVKQYKLRKPRLYANGITYPLANDRPDLECPYCGSRCLRRYGHTHTRRIPRAMCDDCHRAFQYDQPVHIAYGKDLTKQGYPVKEIIKMIANKKGVEVNRKTVVGWKAAEARSLKYSV